MKSTAGDRNDLLVTAIAKLEASRKKQQTLLAKVHQLQQTASASPATSSSEPKGVLSPDDAVDNADPDNLPTFEPASKEQLDGCGNLYRILQQWNLHGCRAVTFGMLRAHTLASSDIDVLMQILLGANLWKAWFGKMKGTIADSDWVPRQTLTFAAIALERLKTKYDQGEEAKTIAKEGFSAMTEACKRRREE